MKIALVYPPFVSEATSPPLGVNLLKAYLKKEFPDVEIKVFDLNIEFYHKALEKIDGSKFYPENINASVISKIKEAAELFQSPLKDEFYNRKGYNVRGALFIDFFHRIYKKDIESLKDNDHTADEKIKDLIKDVIDFEPDMVGISVMYTSQAPYSMAISGLFKEKNIPVVLGGAKVSFYPELFEKFLGKRFDLMITGEGEAGFKELVKNLKDGSGSDHVPGLVRIKDGTIVRNDASETIDINDLPAPDFSDLDLKKYFSPIPILPVLTSKGCFWQRCTFCNHHKTYTLKFRPKDIDKVIDEIKHLKKQYNAEYFYLCDEMISAKRLREISLRLKDENINYLALAKPLEDFDDENLKIISKGGCRMLLWGVESGCQRVLDKMKKGTKKETISKVLNASKNAGIYNFLYMITGFPTETKEEYFETLDFLEQNNDAVDFLINSPFAIEQNTPIFNNPEKFGIKNITKKQNNDFHYNLEFEKTIGLSDEEVKELNSKKYFYKFNKYPLAFTRLRDHLLLYLSKDSK